jgi:hypothetical protein
LRPPPIIKLHPPSQLLALQTPTRVAEGRGTQVASRLLGAPSRRREGPPAAAPPPPAPLPTTRIHRRLQGPPRPWVSTLTVRLRALLSFLLACTTAQAPTHHTTIISSSRVGHPRDPSSHNGTSPTHPTPTPDPTLPEVPPTTTISDPRLSPLIPSRLNSLQVHICNLVHQTHRGCLDFFLIGYLTMDLCPFLGELPLTLASPTTVFMS